MDCTDYMFIESEFLIVYLAMHRDSNMGSHDTSTPKQQPQPKKVFAAKTRLKADGDADAHDAVARHADVPEWVKVRERIFAARSFRRADDGNARHATPPILPSNSDDADEDESESDDTPQRVRTTTTVRGGRSASVIAGMPTPPPAGDSIDDADGGNDREGDATTDGLNDSEAVSRVGNNTPLPMQGGVLTAEEIIAALSPDQPSVVFDDSHWDYGDLVKPSQGGMSSA